VVVRYAKLEHSNSACARQIHALLMQSYAVEAEVLGLDTFPPLSRPVADVQGARARFYGGLEGEQLVAVGEVEGDAERGWNIASFAVHPAMLRRGIGSGLLGYLLDELRPGVVTVATAADNRPALGLYAHYGFRPCERWVTREQIPMVRLRKPQELGT
jgi:GNAT superfamily N-acetyltransferase